MGVLGVLLMIIREDIRNHCTQPSWALIEALFEDQEHKSKVPTPPQPSKVPATPQPSKAPTPAQPSKVPTPPQPSRVPTPPQPTNSVPSPHTTPHMNPATSGIPPPSYASVARPYVPKVTPLMDIVFSKEDVARLFPTKHEPYRQNSNKKYSVELTLDQLIVFWSVFPEWIPSLQHCPFRDPQAFLVFPTLKHHHGV